MKYHGEYEVVAEFVEGDSIRWRLTGNGEYILGKKGRKTYFIKRNMHVRRPVRELPARVYERYKTEADALEQKQDALRARMRRLDLRRDRVVAEEENFWDADNMFVTVTPFVEAQHELSFRPSGCPDEAYVGLAARAARSLAALHECGVIHADLKEKNILVSFEREKYLPWLIDFDSSFPADAVPAWDAIGGTEGYQSPEVLKYGSDEGAASATEITPAADVFSLAVVFHRWRTGAFPHAVGEERVSAGSALLSGKPVAIGREFDAIMVGNGQPMRALLQWMTERDPSARATAEQAAQVLEGRLSVPERYCARAFSGGDEGLWEAHCTLAELYKPATLKKKGVSAIGRVLDGAGEEGKKYAISYTDGSKKTVTLDELCSAGYAKRLKTCIDAPWEEHRIEFAPDEVFSAKGYCRLERVEAGFRKRYLLISRNGTQFDRSCEWLIGEGLARPRSVVIDADTPWPEHGTAYEAAAMERFGVTKIARMETCGEHRYRLVYREMKDGKNKVNENVPEKNMKLMGFIK